VSQLADGLESVQLAMSERVLHSAESAWAGRAPGADMTGVVPHLCHALRDALGVARSRGGRLPVPDHEDDESSAEAEAALARELSLPGTGGTTVKVFPLTVWDGPSAVAYRWPGDHECVGVARRLLRRHLVAWRMAEAVDTAELVLSELATNAVRHASGPDDRLIETRFERMPDGSLRIEVHDADDSKPERREPSAEANSGRGLLLVDVLTGGRWGVSDREGGGKLIWAQCGSGVTEVAR
jgi:anti-sigma regulatory factor (Ser/Thr protein kinase)